MRRRGIMLGALLGSGGLFAADTALWFWASEHLQAGFVAWQETARAAGWDTRSAAVRRSGWPLSARLEAPDLRLSQAASGGLSWSVPLLTLSLHPWHAGTVTVAASGPQTLRVPGLPEIDLVADTASVTVAADGTTSGLVARGLRAGPSASAAAAGWLRIDALRLQPAGGASMTGQASGIHLPDHGLRWGLRWALGPDVATLNWSADLSGPRPAPTGDAVAIARAWRDSGGRLDIRVLALRWGPLALSGTATLGLDRQLQPDGTGEARVAGYAQTLDAMADAGAIGRHAATAAKALLSLIAAAPADAGAGPDTVDVPLELHDGTLSISRIPLLLLPKLTWPDHQAPQQF